MNPTSILIANAHYLSRIGLEHLIEEDDRFELIGNVKNSDALEKELGKRQPQLVILDYNQPGYFDVAAVEKIQNHAPDSGILIISDDLDRKRMFDVIEQGVNAYLTKECESDEIIDAIEATAEGKRFFCNRVLDHILKKSFSDEEEEENCEATPLTPREREIVTYITRGMVAKEIAAELNLSTHTIYTHRKNIMRKLEISSTSELVIYAINEGLVDEEALAREQGQGA